MATEKERDAASGVTLPPLVCRADRETAARITEEIGNLMKEIENLVEEKKKDSSEMTKFVSPQEGECRVLRKDLEQQAAKS